MKRSAPIAAVAALVALPAFACDGLEVSGAVARASGAMAQAGAAYMTLANTGEADCRLVAARAEISDRVELHRHEEDGDGVMRMVEIEDGILIPAGGEHRLEPGGDHIMFMGLNRPIEYGERITLTLVFEDGGETVVEVPVDMERTGLHGSAGEPAHGHAHGHAHDHAPGKAQGGDGHGHGD